VSHGVFADAADVALKNPFDDTTPLFSFLGNIDVLKAAADPYHLKLCYPELTQYPSPCNEWTQTKSPMVATSTNNINFQAIDTVFNIDGAGGSFRGLGKNRAGKNTKTVMDASPHHINFWYSIGALESWSNYILGPPNKFVSHVEIYMKRSQPTISGP
jgi:hypothetical protein